MRDSADHSPELRLKVIERIQKRAIHAEVTYSLEEMYGDDGKILQGAIDLHVFIDYEDKVQIGTGEIFQISHFMISEAYLEDFADCQSGHFLDAATWWNKSETAADFKDDHERWYYLSKFEIKKEYRRLGIGSHAVDIALRTAGALDFPVVIYPDKDAEMGHENLVKFWLSTHRKAKYDKENSIVYVDWWSKE